jgi:mannose-6-phosphate isomerase-like protein (cupin superfamily)
MVDWLKEEPNSTEGGKKLGPDQGAVNGFSMGLTYCNGEEYGSQAHHEDQEGFYVISGEGYALLGDTEYKLTPGMFFIAKAGEGHTMRKTSEEPLKLLWAHGAIE